LYPTHKEKEPLYLVDGQWTASFSVKDAKTKKEISTYDPFQTPLTSLTVPTIEQQDELESRRAWQKVAHAISKGDMDLTAAEKTKIENEQRDLRKKEKDEGREWERLFFTRQNGDAVFEALAKGIGEVLDADKTDGVWLWDSKKAENAKPPFKK
jgi:hypothetical protein